MNVDQDKFIHMFYEMVKDFKKVRDNVDEIIKLLNGRAVQENLKNLKVDLDKIYNFIEPILEEKKDGEYTRSTESANTSGN